MPSFPKPSYYHDFIVNNEIHTLRNYRDTEPGRKIPSKTGNRLLISTWNIANLGLHKRTEKEYKVMAELISWFDIVALQEVNDNLIGLRSIQKFLPNKYSTVFSDKAGNNERMSFFYDSSKVNLMEKFGEVAVPPKDIKYIKLNGIQEKYQGFDRNPFLVSFNAGNFKFLLVNVHLYFGDDTQKNRNRRALEAYAVSRWADLRQDSKNSYLKDIIVLGDFNIPKVKPGDVIYDALRKRGLRKPEHSTKIGSNISNDKNYDQVMFFPGQTKNDFSGNMGIFDFDGSIFRDLWNSKTHAQFKAYLRYYISDHRIMWAEFKI